jgi:hypothetical protein
MMSDLPKKVWISTQASGESHWVTDLSFPKAMCGHEFTMGKAIQFPSNRFTSDCDICNAKHLEALKLTMQSTTQAELFSALDEITTDIIEDDYDATRPLISGDMLDGDE